MRRLTIEIEDDTIPYEVALKCVHNVISKGREDKHFQGIKFFEGGVRVFNKCLSKPNAELFKIDLYEG